MIKDTSGQDTVLETTFRWPKAWIAVGLLGVVFIIVIATLGIPTMNRLFSADKTIHRERLRFAMVETGNLQQDISAQGRIVAANSPTLFAPAAGVISLYVKAGDQVEAGKLLATINSPELNNQYQQELAVLEQQKIEIGRYKIQIKTDNLDNQQLVEQSAVDLKAAKVELDRAQKGLQQQFISQQDFDAAQVIFEKAMLASEHAKQQESLTRERMAFELQSRELQLNRQQFVVEDIKRQVSELQLIAATDGIIGSVTPRNKDHVLANDSLITLIDLSAFEAEVQIPESYADDLGVGLPSEITVNGEQHSAKLVAISPEVTNGQVVGRLRFDKHATAKLRQNQRVSARILIQSHTDVTKVRRGDFVESGGASIGFVVKDNTAHRIPIQLGARSVSEVEVVSGLNPGDEIIISSLDELKQYETVFLSD